MCLQLPESPNERSLNKIKFQNLHIQLEKLNIRSINIIIPEKKRLDEETVF